MEMMMNDDEVDWLDLPLDLLSEIADKVTSSSLEDHVRFGCICVPWRSFFLENNYEQIKLSNLPILLIPSLDHHHHTNYQKDRVDSDISIMYNYYSQRETWLGLYPKERHTSTRSFYSLSEKKVYDFQLQVPTNLHCRGSSHGWLLLVEECLDGTYPVHLFNPFRSSSLDHKKNKIQLPPLTSCYPDQPVINSSLFNKFVFSTDPSSSSSLLLSNPTTTDIDENDFLVLGLYGACSIGFCRPGDRAWTTLPSEHGNVCDVICYKGQFWGIVQNGGAFALDIYPEPKVTLRVYPHQEDFNGPVVRYLVESAGDLFNVRRDHSFPGEPEDVAYNTKGFHVFKLDQTTMEWVKTNTLDGRIFFVGDNASISLSPSDYFPGSCKPNSIYFTDDYVEFNQFTPWDGPHDIGVFNLEDGRYAIGKRASYSHILQVSVSLCQLYGTLVYCGTAFLDGDNFAASPLYYYAYYVLANSFWVWVPAVIIIRSWKKICAAPQVQSQTENQKKSKTR